MPSSDEKFSPSDSNNEESEAEGAVNKSQHKCPEPGCKAVFNRPYRLKNHVATHHRKEKLYKCDFEGCDKSYSNQSHLKRHKSTIHTDEERVSTSEVMCSVEGCRMVCANKYSLKKHTSRAHTDLPFECVTCLKKFRRKSYLAQHKIKEHNEAPPYECAQCSAGFAHYHLYHKHVTRHKTYKCDCGSIFDKWSQYQKHCRLECQMPKTQHECAICQKTFTTKFNLRQHSLVHLQESQNDNFTCPYLECNRAYKYKKNLTSHMKTFHEKVFEYFKCPKEGCDITLKTNRNLKQHLRVCQTVRPVKVRAPRKDKGVKKVSVAAKLSGYSELKTLGEVGEGSSKHAEGELPERADKDVGVGVVRDELIEGGSPLSVSPHEGVGGVSINILNEEESPLSMRFHEDVGDVPIMELNEEDSPLSVRPDDDPGDGVPPKELTEGGSLLSVSPHEGVSDVVIMELNGEDFPLSVRPDDDPGDGVLPKKLTEGGSLLSVSPHEGVNDVVIMELNGEDFPLSVRPDDDPGDGVPPKELIEGGSLLSVRPGGDVDDVTIMALNEEDSPLSGRPDFGDGLTKGELTEQGSKCHSEDVATWELKLDSSTSSAETLLGPSLIEGINFMVIKLPPETANQV